MDGPGNPDPLWSGEEGAGGISWADRSRMGLLRGVIDAADATGRRNAYMHALHRTVLERELVRAGPLTSVLDFGCGTGRFIATLSSHASHVVAADKEQAMVDAARTYAGGYGAEIIRCDIASLPFGDATFDLALCSSVLCVTVRRMVPAIVQELARVVRSSGTLLLLEQVSDRRDLPVSFYSNALSDAGFTMLRAYPIRSCNSFFTRFVTRNAWMPSAWFPKLAAAELVVVAPKWSADYTEFAMVARR